MRSPPSANARCRRHVTSGRGASRPHWSGGLGSLLTRCDGAGRGGRRSASRPLASPALAPWHDAWAPDRSDPFTVVLPPLVSFRWPSRPIASHVTVVSTALYNALPGLELQQQRQAGGVSPAPSVAVSRQPPLCPAPGPTVQCAAATVLRGTSPTRCGPTGCVRCPLNHFTVHQATSNFLAAIIDFQVDFWLFFGKHECILLRSCQVPSICTVIFWHPHGW